MKPFKTISKLLILGSIILETTSVLSQQISFFNNNIVNPYSINPAMAGFNHNQLFFHHRNELVGLDGSPEFTMLSAEFRVKSSNSGIGFQFSHDQSNVIKNTSGFMTYAHHFKLTKNQDLSFGLSLGVRNNAIAYDRVIVEEDGDEILFDYNQNGTNFDGNFGIAYKFKNLEVQVAGMQLFGSKSDFSNTYDQQEFTYQFARHFVGSVGYQFFEGKKVKIKPIIQVRGIQGLNFIPEGILRFDFNNLFWLAGHYRNDASWAATAGITFSERYTVGYSAEFSTNEISKYNSGTHEIVFAIRIGASKKSSISPSEIKKMEKRNKYYNERVMLLDQENKRLEEEIEKQRKKIKDIENSSTKLDYEEIRKLIEESKKPKVISKKEIKEKLNLNAKSLNFESGNNKFLPSSYSSLNKIVNILKENNEMKVTVSGHTDNLGSSNTNQILSQKRADAVKDYFIQNGIDVKRITATGFGEQQPISSNSTYEGRAQNRRVEIKIIE